MRFLLMTSSLYLAWVLPLAAAEIQPLLQVDERRTETTEVIPYQEARDEDASVTEPADPPASIDSFAFFAPSISYLQLDHESEAANFELSSDLIQLNLEMELLSGDFAYHRLSLGHTLDASSELTSASPSDAEVKASHLAYRLGGINHTAFAGDVTLWTGLGWEGFSVKDNAAGDAYVRYVYLPFGGDLGLRFDTSSFLVFGAEYRLLVRGWEKYNGGSSAYPTQAHGGGYAVWLGIDYVAGNGRVITSRIRWQDWQVDASTADEIPGSQSRSLGLAMGFRF
ncbi:hypothetical protein [Marinospirillum perlucidum]|uniref:hypothetical protein n=1 Tax=Marinospirillum perlucidum TaxID=1982602 RepID=UPI00138FBB28|nr:hypothetical protein [Marinospirillum perlucidum]